MEFVVRKHNKSEFYETFCKWLDLHHFNRINELILPENVFVAYDKDDYPIYCIWIYFTDSKLAWVAFPASNKNIAYKKRQYGLDYLIKYVCNYAKKKGILTLITTSGTDSVIESLVKNEFEVGDTNISHFVRKL